MAESCVSCPFLPSCFVGQLDEKGATLFSNMLHRFTVRGRGAGIFEQGKRVDCCYFLCAGQVKLSRLLEEGDEVILDVLTAPCGLGKGDLLQRSKQFYSVVAITESVDLGYVKTEVLLDVLKDYPSAMRKLFMRLREQTEKVYQLVACMKLRVRERLLCVLALHFLVGVAAETSVTIPLSNIELAQLAQTTPETISRTLRQLEDEGVMDWNARGEITIQTSVLRDYLDRLS